MTSNGKPWTDAELEAAVLGYIFLLNLQRSEVSYPLKHFYQQILGGVLKERTEASVRYRLRNISFVYSSIGLPVLSSFSPASQVGKNVKDRILIITRELNSRNGFYFFDGGAEVSGTGQSGSKQSLSDALTRAEGQLGEISEKIGGMGHNNPPSQEYSEELAEILAELSSKVQAIGTRVNSMEFSPSDLQQEKVSLATLGLKLLNWVGGRLTKFTDAALIVAAPILVAHVTNFGPTLFDLLRQLEAFISSIG